MDPLSAGASVIAFVTVALDGAGKLYNAVAAYRGGPQDVKLLLSALSDLLFLLRRLSTILHDPDNRLLGAFATELETSLKTCVSEISTFNSKLIKCQPRPQEGSLQRFARRLRPVLHQMDLEKMRLAILRHLATLSVQVGLVNSLQAQSMGKTVHGIHEQLQQTLPSQRLQLDSITDSGTTMSLAQQAMGGNIRSIHALVEKLPVLFIQELERLRQDVDLKIDGIGSSVIMRPTDNNIVHINPYHPGQTSAAARGITAALDHWNPWLNVSKNRHLHAIMASCNSFSRTVDRGARDEHALPALQHLFGSIWDQLGAASLDTGEDFRHIIRLTDTADNLAFASRGKLSWPFLHLSDLPAHHIQANFHVSGSMVDLEQRLLRTHKKAPLSTGPGDWNARARLDAGRECSTRLCLSSSRHPREPSRSRYICLRIY